MVSRARGTDLSTTGPEVNLGRGQSQPHRKPGEQKERGVMCSAFKGARMTHPLPCPHTQVLQAHQVTKQAACKHVSDTAPQPPNTSCVLQW